MIESECLSAFSAFQRNIPYPSHVLSTPETYRKFFLIIPRLLRLCAVSLMSPLRRCWQKVVIVVSHRDVLRASVGCLPLLAGIPWCVDAVHLACLLP